MRDWIDQLQDRTKAFAIRIVKFAGQLETTSLPRTLVWQLVDAGTSVAANHRACRRARTTRELASKLAVVEEEADESALWLEVIDAVRSEPKLRAEAALLRAEAVEFRSIFSKARATTRRRLKTHGKEDLPEPGSQ
jgi:four helix bundle protein